MKTKPAKLTISQIYKYRGRIDLEPSFQREKVWSLDKQQYFLDTILREWGVPKFYLKVEGPDNDKNYTCIDGKQRLTSIISFLADQIKLNGKYSKDFGGKIYTELPASIQDKFDAYKLNIEEVITTSGNDDETSELYKRLQGGSPLNSGEKLMAVNGDMRTFVKGLSSHNFFKNKIYIKNTRYTHFIICAQICFLEFMGVTDAGQVKMETFFRAYKTFNDKGIYLSTKTKKIKNILRYLDKMFPTLSKNLKNRAIIVSTYLLVSELMEKGNIAGKEKKLGTFMVNFSEALDRELIKGAKAKDVRLVAYQLAITQGADKQKSIKQRREILLEKLYKEEPEFYKFMNPLNSPERKFEDLYDELEVKFPHSLKNLDMAIKSIDSKVRISKCSISGETLPTHIRNCLHHHEHGSFSSSELSYSIKLLEKIVPRMK